MRRLWLSPLQILGHVQPMPKSLPPIVDSWCIEILNVRVIVKSTINPQFLANIVQVLPLFIFNSSLSLLDSNLNLNKLIEI